MEKPKAPPEGLLLRSAIKSAGLSVRAAAERVNLSDTRLRQILHGYIPVGGGKTAPVIAPAETLARVALEFGISPDSLQEAGRGDAAGILRDWEERRAALPPYIVRGTELDTLAMRELREWLERGSGDLAEDISPPTVCLRLFDTVQLFQGLAERYNDVLADLRRTNRLLREARGEGYSGYPDRAQEIHVEERETAEARAWVESPEHRKAIEEILKDPRERAAQEIAEHFYGDDPVENDQLRAEATEPPRPLSMAELKRRRLLADAMPVEEAAYEGDLD